MSIALPFFGPSRDAWTEDDLQTLRKVYLSHLPDARNATDLCNKILADPRMKHIISVHKYRVVPGVRSDLTNTWKYRLKKAFNDDFDGHYSKKRSYQMNEYSLAELRGFERDISTFPGESADRIKLRQVQDAIKRKMEREQVDTPPPSSVQHTRKKSFEDFLRELANHQISEAEDPYIDPYDAQIDEDPFLPSRFTAGLQDL